MEDKKQMNAIKLMERFSDAKILESKKYQFQVYAIEKNDKGEFYNTKLGISCPTPFFNDNPFFLASLKLFLNSKGGFMLHSHLFQFELVALEMELQKIDDEWAKTLVLPERIANALTDCYHLVLPYLKDYNDTADDIVEIARIINKCRGASVTPKFGI